MPTAGHDTTRGWLDGDGVVHVGAPAAVAATGTVQANAATISVNFTQVTGADGTKGVVLYNDPGRVQIVANNANAILNIYPNSGAAINNGSANAASTVAAYGVTYLFQESATQWWRQ